MLKPVSTTISLIVLSTLLIACNHKGSDVAETVKLESDTNKASYSIGVQMGTQIATIKDFINEDAILMGFKDSFAGKEPQISQEDMKLAMQAFQQKMAEQKQAEQKVAATSNKADGDKFLSENKSKEGIKTTESGLQYKVLVEGKGATPAATDTVVTHYVGTSINGNEFDSSYKRNSPATFPVNGVIKGWTEALQLMKVGARWQLFIPSELAYGARGAGANIGPNEVLIFEIELLEIKKS